MLLTANNNTANKHYLLYLYHTPPQSLNFILHIELNYSQYSRNDIKFVANKLQQHHNLQQEEPLTDKEVGICNVQLLPFYISKSNSHSICVTEYSFGFSWIVVRGAWTWNLLNWIKHINLMPTRGFWHH